MLSVYIILIYSVLWDPEELWGHTYTRTHTCICNENITVFEKKITFMSLWRPACKTFWTNWSLPSALVQRSCSLKVTFSWRDLIYHYQVTVCVPTNWIRPWHNVWFGIMLHLLSDMLTSTGTVPNMQRERLCHNSPGIISDLKMTSDSGCVSDLCCVPLHSKMYILQLKDSVRVTGIIV